MKFIEPSFKGMVSSGDLKGQWVFGTGLSFVEFSDDYKKETGREGNWYLDLTDYDGHAIVDGDTIGQFIGKTDVEGEKIYSGDNVLITYTNGSKYIAKVVYDIESVSYRLEIDEDTTVPFNNCLISKLIINGVVELSNKNVISEIKVM
ncbi:hypothetical protein ACWN8V_07010 [Vagococcus elongatus]|uniref:YopX protein domain-containing protein n=1 Tax=Vagococcus elongatus TaxID=180344 RepID=A0A430AW39_9ENTE|nr:hypothetical protein [Vagococcus elongatus]RSU12282.1 hypothetical protein CBF29_06690 [Vagococcus elongatus]